MRILLLIMVFLFTVTGLPALIIQYDDGSSEDYCEAGSDGWEVAEWFYPPSYPCTLTAAMFYPYNTNAIYWKVWDDDGPIGPPGEPLTILRSGIYYPTTTMNWVTINITPPVVITEGAFYIGWTEYAPAYWNGFDTTPPHYNQCCFHYEYFEMWFWSLFSDPLLEIYGDLLIRAVVGSSVPVVEKEVAKNAFKISVYPNPFNSYCNIDAPDARAIEVLDIQGKIVQKFSGKSVRWEPSKNLTSGLYFINADFGDRVVKVSVILLK